MSWESKENRKVTEELLRLSGRPRSIDYRASPTNMSTSSIGELENLLIQILPPEHSLSQHLRRSSVSQGASRSASRVGASRSVSQGASRSSSRSASRDQPQSINSINLRKFREPIRQSVRDLEFIEMRDMSRVAPPVLFSANVPPRAVKPRVYNATLGRRPVSPDTLKKIEIARQMIKFGKSKQRKKKSVGGKKKSKSMKGRKKSKK